MNRRLLLTTVPLLLAALAFLASPTTGSAGPPAAGTMPGGRAPSNMRPTNAQRSAAAARLADARGTNVLGGLVARLKALVSPAALDPGGVPDYFGSIPNYATSPLPSLDGLGHVVPGTGIRKFVDSLPGLGAGAANDLGQYIPVATPDTATYPGSDYYVIGLVEYTEKLHKDLPPTKLRGYVQLNNAGTAQLAPPSYLGPTIVAQRNRPVRVKFINQLPTGLGGNLFLPVDTTVMGAGMGPNGVDMYTQNRATLHLHGGLTPWISDGTPHQWTTPATEGTPYQEGVSVKNVPDMDGGNEPTGTLTFYYTNQQSARLMFYHDHAFGITRLNVYAGEAAPYLLQDPVEQALVNGGSFKANGTTVTVAAGTVPADQIPLVIQDKTFVPNDTQLAAQDPTWDKAKWGGLGSLWLPHVYMPNQNPDDPGGVNAVGRWDYNPWVVPPLEGQIHGPVPNPLAGLPGENSLNPGTPNPTIVPESFMDTPLVNGTAYPFVKVGRKAYRFRILNACDDRMLNLQLYYAKSNTPDSVDASGNPTLQTNSGEVTMVPAAVSISSPLPPTWPVDGRDGGVPDPNSVGPSMIQIGNEAGFIPSATVLPNTPVGYEYFRRTITVLNVTNKTLMLGPAERADVIVDFSGVPDGSKIILYNDAPAPVPAFDSRLDYYTGDPDQVSIGGAPTTQPGYGPNTRTIMQFQVGGTAASTFSLSQLQTGLKAAYAASQDTPIVPEKAYGPAYNTTYPNNYVRILDTALTFQPVGSASNVTLPTTSKAIIEGFELDYGRMNAQLGTALPNTGPTGGAAQPYSYVDPPTDGSTDIPAGTQIGALADGTQIWRINHQGVDTHAIHFHLFNVQLINRVAIDGTFSEPDANELGWKETVRMNPGQDVIVALRPKSMSLPFKIPDSIRLLNPAMSAGATWTVSNLPGGDVVTNVMTNFGWEYVWHCHLLGHEESDMMRPFDLAVSPAAPTGLNAVRGATQVNLSWTNHATNPAATNYYVERATNAAFTSGVATFSVAGTPSTFPNTGAPAGTLFYRVRAENAVSYSAWAAGSTAGGGGALTIGATPTSVRLPAPFVLQGVLTPGAPGGIVAVYVKKPGRVTWSYSSNRVLSATSVWWYRYHPLARGTYQFFALRGTARSVTISVIVR
jgi:FtsP/CotA-like multicopper oxidase with cupredoxin domain